MQFGKTMSVWMVVGALAAMVTGCATETGDDVQGDENGSEQGEETASVSQAAISCPSGYHAHSVDWGTAGLYPWGSCTPNGTNLSYGHQVCQRDGGTDYSCDGSGMVFVMTFIHGLQKNGAMKLCALNGHC